MAPNRGGGLDESPHCYKNLQTVLDAHAGTIKILHVLRPIGVAMADTEDPYRLRSIRRFFTKGAKHAKKGQWTAPPDAVASKGDSAGL